jgi:hypothetical protein
MSTRYVPIDLTQATVDAIDAEAKSLGVSRNRYLKALVTAARAAYAGRLAELEPFVPEVPSQKGIRCPARGNWARSRKDRAADRSEVGELQPR